MNTHTEGTGHRNTVKQTHETDYTKHNYKFWDSSSIALCRLSKFENSSHSAFKATSRCASGLSENGAECEKNCQQIPFLASIASQCIIRHWDSLLGLNTTLTFRFISSTRINKSDVIKWVMFTIPFFRKIYGVANPCVLKSYIFFKLV